MLSPGCKNSLLIHILYSLCLVNEKTDAESMLVIVEGFFFLAKTTGKSKRKPIIIAGAMPDASTVRILLTPNKLKRSENSAAIDFIKLGSI